MLAASLAHAETLPPGEVRVEIGHNPIGGFDPRQALGGGIDGHWEGETEDMLAPERVRKMLDAGLGPVSLRLRTELAVDAWHWNPRGRWSDPKHSQGYWTSESQPDPKNPICVSYGYKLPRRGNTLDEANDDGYSRLNDGDPKTFWKSNPYLTQAYTGEPDRRHPQWVVLDFGKPVPINVINILWGEPFATTFRLEYATKGGVYFGGHPWNVWHCFPQGCIRHGKGGDQVIKLSRHPLRARYLRIWMTEGSGSALPGATDPRDHFGYAIREIRAGEARRFDFDDHVLHRPDKKQTLCYASSTDPWHRACDRDLKTEQPGIDRIARCGITRGLPLMLAIPVLYDTPENGSALASYTRRTGIPMSRLELGEEPDGQRVDPRDFGALYAQSARLIRSRVPDAVMGGPSFVTVDVARDDDQTYRFDKRCWIRGFRRELARWGQSGDLRFLSFEWYPFDDVSEPESKQLPKACGMMERALARLQREHLPLVIGEFNYSVFPCRPEVDLSGALLNAEIAAQFLCGGGDAAYFYSYEPNKLEQTYGSWGNQIMLLKEGKSSASIPLATFHALRLLAREWMNPLGGYHQVLPVRLPGMEGHCSLISAFALKRPDGSQSLLVINKDAKRPARLLLQGLGRNPVTLATLSAAEYSWHPDGAKGRTSRNLPPSNRKIAATQAAVIPPCSIAVLHAR